MLQLWEGGRREGGGVLCSVKASSGGAGKCPRPPSMAGRPGPPCTSWCPSWGWGCSGPGWRPGGPSPGRCPRPSSGGATARRAAPAGPSTCRGRPPRSPSASWFYRRPPAPRRQSCSLARRRPAERPALPARRSRPHSSPGANQHSSPRTAARRQRRRVWWSVSWRWSSDWRWLQRWLSVRSRLLLLKLQTNFAHFYMVLRRTGPRRHHFPLRLLPSRWGN